MTDHFKPLQWAYRKQHSPETAEELSLSYAADTPPWLKILDVLNKVVISGNTVVLVGLDLSSAFDTIECDILLDRLRTVFGVSREVQVWIATYLRGRKQYVVAGGELFLAFGLRLRRSAGFRARPIFLLHLSLTTHRHHHSARRTIPLYADDTQLYIIHSNNDLARLEKCTSSVKDWFTETPMLLNPDKS